MINGAHTILFSADADATRDALREVLGTRSVDAGGGWLIFALPPAELGVHPIGADDAPHHEISLVCDDIHATVAALRAHDVEVRGEPVDRGFGIAATVVLPGGVDVLLYEPRHPTAI